MRWLLVLICYFMALLHVNGQDQPVFEKKIVKDSTGTIYWPLSLPVYVQLSSQPDAKEGVMLTAVKEKYMNEFAVPLKWDGHGIHYIRHVDNLNAKLQEKEISFPVHVDGLAPITSLTLKGAPTYNGSKLFFGKGLVGQLSGKDEMSGIASTHQSINAQAFALYSTVISFSNEGEFAVRYFSVDRVGNAEKTQSKVFTVDLTAPATSFEVKTDHLDGKILSPRSRLFLHSEDNLSGVLKTEFSFSGAKPAVYQQQLGMYGLADGEHTFYHFSTDRVKNVETTKVFSFYLDAKAPEVTSSIEGHFAAVNGRIYTAKAATIQLSATDNKAGVKSVYFSINGGPETLYSSPFNLPPRQGAYVVRFRGVDNVNNTSALASNDQLKSLFLDDTPPTISHEIGTPKVYTRDTLFITKESTITLNSIDRESGAANIIYTLDKTTSLDFEKPIQVASEGKHALTYTGYDKVNNSASKSFVFVVDNTPPEIFWHMSLEKLATQKVQGKTDELPIYASGTSIYLAATDKTVGTKSILYSLNGQAELPYSQPIKCDRKGTYSLKIRAVDYLNNSKTSDLIEFVIQ